MEREWEPDVGKGGAIRMLDGVMSATHASGAIDEANA
jgi:hypothetical protein